MSNCIIILMPDTADLTELSEDVQEIIQASTIWPGGTMFGTHPVNGYRLWHGKTSLSKEAVEAAIQAEGVDWTIMGMRTWESSLQFDAEGNPVLDEDGFQIKAPIEHVPLNPAIWDYVVPPVDEEGNTLPLPDSIGMPMYSKRGIEPWVLTR